MVTPRTIAIIRTKIAGQRIFTRRSGLTLVEVLLALVILGIGVMVLLTTASQGIAVARRARQYEHARRLIAQLNRERPLLAESVDAGRESGAFDPPFEQYRWERIIEQVIEEDEQPGDADSGLFRITSVIHWSDRGRERSESVTTMIYLPPGELDESF